jgi:hypothetical protein
LTKSRYFDGMHMVDLTEKMKDASFEDMTLYYKLFKLWAMQRKVTIELLTNEKGHYAYFTDPMDAMLFKLTVYNFDTGRRK